MKGSKIYEDDEIEVYVYTEDDIADAIRECISEGARSIRDLRECVVSKGINVSDDRLGRILSERFGSRIIRL